MSIENLRLELDLRRGQFGRIADMAGVNRKTIQRIADEDGYNPTLATFHRVLDAVQKVKPKSVAA
jgi:DNA-binding phage protein